MNSFKFNFSKFGKPKIKSNNLPRRRIATGLIGVIGIRLNATYYVQIGDKQYDLTLESYDIKDKNVYYAKKLQNNKIVEIINSVPNYDQIYSAMKRAGCLTDVKQRDLDPEIYEKGLLYHPYMRRRLSLRRLSNMIDFEKSE